MAAQEIIGPRPAIGAGMALMGVGMVLFSTLEIGDGYADLMPGVLLVGVGAALAMPLVMYVLKAVPEKRAGVASGVINVIREASGAFGIAIVGLLIQTVPDEGASAKALESFRQGTSSGLVLGAGVLTWATVHLPLPLSAGWLALLVVNLLASAGVALSFCYLWGSLAFWAPRAAEEISSSSLSLVSHLKGFPLDVAGPILTGGLMTVVPVGFVAWYPCRSLLGIDAGGWSGAADSPMSRRSNSRMNSPTSGLRSSCRSLIGPTCPLM